MLLWLAMGELNQIEMACPLRLSGNDIRLQRQFGTGFATFCFEWCMKGSHYG